MVETEGVRMYINPKDSAVSRFIIQKGGYEVGTTRLFKAILAKDMIFFDIGAHWGYYSLIAASLGAKVFAFEPHPFNYELLVKSVSVNGFNDRIIPIRKAVSDKTGRARLYCQVHDISHSLIPLKEARELEVETVSLDDFCKQHNVLPDVVKMDVEGAEILALRGMRRVIEKRTSLRCS